jgi:hypothetical protein
MGAVDVEAFGGELAGQRDGMLPFGTGSVARGGGGVADGDPGGGQGGQREGEQASDHCLPPADGSPVSMAAGVQEVALGLAERRVAGGVGGDPGCGAGRCLQQAAAPTPPGAWSNFRRPGSPTTAPATDRYQHPRRRRARRLLSVCELDTRDGGSTGFTA